jgi:hypothetical protein
MQEEKSCNRRTWAEINTKRRNEVAGNNSRVKWKSSLVVLFFWLPAAAVKPITSVLNAGVRNREVASRSRESSNLPLSAKHLTSSV